MRVLLSTIALCVVMGTAVMGQEPSTLTTANAISRAAKKVTPEYPVAARQLNIQGQQEVSIVVSAQGDVTEAKALKGNAMFTAASVAAAKQWKFTPYVKDGQPTQFTSTLVFNYTK